MMSGDKPTEDELETARDVLTWYQEYLEENEPSATGAIRALEEASMNLPSSMEDLEG